MSANYQLVLLCSDTRGQGDFEAAVSAIGYFSQTNQFKVVASLHTSAIEILKAVKQRIHVACRLDAAWNTLSTPMSPRLLVPASALESTATLLQAEYVPRELPFENPDELSRRLRTALFTPSACSLVVLMPLSNIKICTNLLGQQCEQAPEVSMWTIYTDECRGESTLWCIKREDLKYAVPVPQTLESSEPLSQPPSQSVEEFERIFKSRASQLCEQLTASLSFSLRTCPAASGPASLLIAQVVNTFQSLQERYDRANDSLKRAIGESAAYSVAQETKLAAAMQEWEKIMQAQTAIEEEIGRIAAITTAVSELKANLATCEVRQAELSRQLATSQPRSRNAFPLTIQSVFHNEYNCPFATIVSHKRYPVQGFLQFTQNGAEVSLFQYVFPPLSSTVVDLTGSAPQGKWQLTVVHCMDRTAISNSAEGEVWGTPQREQPITSEYSIHMRPLAQTMVHKVAQNFEDYEGIMKGKMGDAGVTLLHQLCKGWQNEDESRVQEFLYIVADEKLLTREEISRRLMDRGFQI